MCNAIPAFDYAFISGNNIICMNYINNEWKKLSMEREMLDIITHQIRERHTIKKVSGKYIVIEKLYTWRYKTHNPHINHSKFHKHL